MCYLDEIFRHKQFSWLNDIKMQDMLYFYLGFCLQQGMKFSELCVEGKQEQA